jgi:hypothetical protein
MPDIDFTRRGLGVARINSIRVRSSAPHKSSNGQSSDSRRWNQQWVADLKREIRRLPLGAHVAWLLHGSWAETMRCLHRAFHARFAQV